MRFQWRDKNIRSNDKIGIRSCSEMYMHSSWFARDSDSDIRCKCIFGLSMEALSPGPQCMRNPVPLRVDGGETRMDNLVPLCRKHHRLVQEGGFSVTTNHAGRVEFARPDGEIIVTSPAPRSRGNLVHLLRANERNGLNITPKTPVPRWFGEKMDHGLAVLSLLQME